MRAMTMNSESFLLLELHRNAERWTHSMGVWWTWLLGRIHMHISFRILQCDKTPP